MPSTVNEDLTLWGPAASGHPTPPSLAEAEAYCRRLATTHYENFPIVSWLLPRNLHQHFFNVYAFCRWADDLGDESGDPDTRPGIARLVAERKSNAVIAARRHHPVFVALKPNDRPLPNSAGAVSRSDLGVRAGSAVQEYDTFEQLRDYCRRSADPVGRLVLLVCEQATPEKIAWSDSICTGLQLANFWQDVRRDFDIGRIYLPREDYERFGYPAKRFRWPRTNAAFLELMRFEVDRARRFLHRRTAARRADAGPVADGHRTVRPRRVVHSGPDRRNRLSRLGNAAEGHEVGHAAAVGREHVAEDHEKNRLDAQRDAPLQGSRRG